MERLADATELGVHITVQQAQLDGLAPALVACLDQRRYGPSHRAARPAARSAWHDHAEDTGRVLGFDHAIDRGEAFRLYTTAGAGFLGSTATLTPGAQADFVAYPADPLTCPTDDLPRLAPALTVVGGEVVHRSA